MDLFGICHLLALLGGLYLYFINREKLEMKKRYLGYVYEQWSSHFLFLFPLNILAWILILLYFYWSFTLILSDSHRYAGYTGTTILLYSFSYIPRFVNIIGAEGIYLSKEMIQWKRLKKVQVIKIKGIFVCVKLVWINGKNPFRIKHKKIPIAAHRVNAINKIISRRKKGL